MSLCEETTLCNSQFSCFWHLWFRPPMRVWPHVVKKNVDPAGFHHTLSYSSCLMVFWSSHVSLSFFLKLSPPSHPIAELTRRLSDQLSFVKASSGVIYSWIHSGGIHLATCQRSARVAASQRGLLQSLQSPKTTPYRSSKTATRLQRGLRFQETSLRPSRAATRCSIFRRVQTKTQTVIYLLAVMFFQPCETVFFCGECMRSIHPAFLCNNR